MRPEPIVFELTEAEAEVAGARAAWRSWLDAGFVRRRVAPLVIFALALIAATMLGMSGAISRRAAEMGLILAAILFLAAQLALRRGLAAARRSGAQIAGDLRRSGAARLTLEAEGFTLQAGAASTWRFDDGLEIEATDELIYVWPRTGRPLVWPRRAHPDAKAAETFLAFARAKIVPRV